MLHSLYTSWRLDLLSLVVKVRRLPLLENWFFFKPKWIIILTSVSSIMQMSTVLQSAIQCILQYKMHCNIAKRHISKQYVCVLHLLQVEGEDKKEQKKIKKRIKNGIRIIEFSSILIHSCCHIPSLSIWDLLTVINTSTCWLYFFHIHLQLHIRFWFHNLRKFLQHLETSAECPGGGNIGWNLLSLLFKLKPYNFAMLAEFSLFRICKTCKTFRVKTNNHFFLCKSL